MSTAGAGGPTEDDWKKITKLVDQFYNRADAGTHVLARAFVFFTTMRRRVAACCCLAAAIHAMQCVLLVLSPMPNKAYKAHVYISFVFVFLAVDDFFFTEPFRAPVDWKNLGELQHYVLLYERCIYMCWDSRWWINEYLFWGLLIMALGRGGGGGGASLDSKKSHANNRNYSRRYFFSPSNTTYRLDGLSKDYYASHGPGDD
jgi:hypothetical protein